MDTDTWTITHEPTDDRPERYVIRLNGDAVDVVDDGRQSAETLAATRAELRSEWLARPYTLNA